MGPFIKDKNNGTKMMTHFLIALIPIIIFSLIKTGNTGIQTLILILTTTITTVLFESIFNIIKEKNIKNILKDNYGVLKGIILGLILPPTTPLLLIIVGLLIATIISKTLYLLFKKNIINQTILSCILILLLTKFLSPSINNLDQTLANQNILNDIGTYETLVKPYGGLTKIFIGNIMGTLGTMSAALSILSLIYLTLTKVIKWRIPTIYILTVFAITYVIGGTNDLGIWYPLFQIFTGGLIFKSIFLAAEQETSPVTPIGQILYAIFLGILTVTFRFLIPILIMNLLIPLLDKIGATARFNFKTTIIPFIITWILIIGLSMGISIKYNTNNNNIPNIENKK